jgi:hypothetical protein
MPPGRRDGDAVPKDTDASGNREVGWKLDMQVA